MALTIMESLVLQLRQSEPVSVGPHNTDAPAALDGSAVRKPPEQAQCGERECVTPLGHYRAQCGSTGPYSAQLRRYTYPHALFTPTDA